MEYPLYRYQDVDHTQLRLAREEIERAPVSDDHIYGRVAGTFDNLRIRARSLQRVSLWAGARLVKTATFGEIKSYLTRRGVDWRAFR